jgi:hypothetical protein
MTPAHRRLSKATRKQLNAQWRRDGLDLEQRAHRFRQSRSAGGIGARGLESYRLANDLSQTDVAAIYIDRFGGGVTASIISRWEAWPDGHKPIRPNLDVLQRLAAIYETTVVNLVAAIYEHQPRANLEDGWSSPSSPGPPGEAVGITTPRQDRYVGPGEVGIPAHVQRLRDRLMLYESIDGLPTGQPPDPQALRRKLSATWRAFQHSDYSALATRLPGLLDEATLARAALDDSAEPLTSEILSEALQLTAILLLKEGHSNLAWVAADRAMAAAERAQSDLSIAGAARILAYALLESQHFEKARTLCLGAAARLEPRLNDRSPERISSHGALLLKAAMAAAMQDDRAGTAELLRAAETSAGRLGRDANYLWTAFGPTNVAVHRVSAAVELGDAGAAIDHARQVRPHQLPVLERRAHHLIDIARAQGLRQRSDDALSALLEAEQMAPEEVHVSPQVRGLVADLLHRTPRHHAELRSLAHRVRVLP